MSSVELPLAGWVIAFCSGFRDRRAGFRWRVDVVEFRGRGRETARKDRSAGAVETVTCTVVTRLCHVSERMCWWTRAAAEEWRLGVSQVHEPGLGRASASGSRDSVLFLLEITTTRIDIDLFLSFSLNGQRLGWGLGGWQRALVDGFAFSTGR